MRRKKQDNFENCIHIRLNPIIKSLNFGAEDVPELFVCKDRYSRVSKKREENLIVFLRNLGKFQILNYLIYVFLYRVISQRIH